MSSVTDNNQSEEGFIFNPDIQCWWRERGDGITDRRDAAEIYTRRQYEAIVEEGYFNLVFQPLDE